MFKKYCLVLLMLLSALPLQAQELDSATLQGILESYAQADNYAVVAYVRYGTATWQGVYGFADVKGEIAVAADDLFRMASMTKPFVATVMLQLVEEGLVDLDAPIATYLPAEVAQNVANTDTATVRNMLQMTSGIMDYLDTDAFYEVYYEVIEASPPYVWTTEEFMSFIYEEDAYFAAGTAYDYSNSNYILAQIIIEEVTGKTLSEELETRILQPLGMETCFLETLDKLGQGIVHGYEDGIDMAEINDGTIGFGDGGLACNARDLAKFLPALLQGQVLSAEALDEMLTTFDDGEDGLYGLGIGMWEWDYGYEVGHDGLCCGFQSSMSYNPEEDLVLILWTNNLNSEILGDLWYDLEISILGSDS